MSEIYNEKVYDLMKSERTSKGLKVKESKILGVVI